MKFKIVILRGLTKLAEVEGQTREKSEISLADMDKVIQTEQFLEHLLGLRVHIQQAE